MFPQTYDSAARAAAEDIARLARERGLSVAVAESLTGGTLAAHLAAAPDSSDWFAGGVVSYQTRVKCDVLHVPEGQPVITEAAALAMCRGVADLMHADAAVAVTGAGGPGPQEGQPAGTVWIAATVGGLQQTRVHHFPGETGAILARTRQHALELLLALISSHDPRGPS